MSDQHEKFIQLRARLLDKAEREGDSALAKGLAHCMLNASGGYAGCPMGQLVVEDYIRTGKLPRGPKPADGKAPNASARVSPQARERQLVRLHKLLEKDAAWRKDDRYLDALHQCEYFMQSNPDCPLYKVLKSD